VFDSLKYEMCTYFETKGVDTNYRLLTYLKTGATDSKLLISICELIYEPIKCCTIV
jgi:hypothetical protein